MIIKFSLVLLTIFLSGYVVVNFLSKGFLLDFIDLICLSFAVGCGVIGIMINFLNCCNIGLNLCSVLTPQALLILLFIAVKGYKGNCLKPRSGSKGSINFLQAALLIVIGFEILYCFVDALSLPFTPNAWDAWCNYGFKAQILFLERKFPFDVWINPVNLPHPDYPLLIPNLGLYIYLFLGKVYEPLFKLFNALFFLILLLVLYNFLRKYFTKTASLLFIACLSILPILSIQSASGYLDIILAFYFSFAILNLLRYLDGGNLQHLLSGLILIGISMWIKPEGLAFWTSTVLALSCLIVFKKLTMPKRHFITVIILPIFIYLPWFIFKSALGLKSDYFSLESMQALNEFPARLVSIVKIFGSEIINLRDWNIFWILFLILLFTLAFRKYRTMQSSLLVIVILFQMIFYWVIFIIWPVSLSVVQVHIFRSASRLMLQLAPLAFIFIVLQIKKISE